MRLNKFHKGATYIVKTTNIDGGKKFWLVQQEGQRTWVATQFTQCIISLNGGRILITGNSIKVAEELNRINYLDDIDFRIVRDKKDMRREMFSILQKGEFENEY